MFFNQQALFLKSLLCLSILISGCSLKTGDSSPQKDPAQLSEKKFSCLTQISEEVDRYFKAEASTEDVRRFMNCAQEALRTFAYYSEDPQKPGYKPEQIAQFLNRYFLPKNKIESGFLKEALRLKVLIAGGSPDLVTYSEFNRLIEIIGILRDEAVRHVPHLALYNNSLSKRASYDQMHQARRDLNRTAQALSAIFLKSKKTYDIQYLKSFLDEVRKFLAWQDYRQNILDSEHLIQLVAAYKGIVTGTNTDTIEPQDWEALLTSSAEILAQIIEYTSVIQKEEHFQGPALENLIDYADRTFNIIQSSIQKQPGKTISISRFEQVVDSLGGLGFLPNNIKAASIKPVLKLAIQRMLRDPHQTQPQGILGLSASGLNEARKEFYIWAESQRHISKMAALRRSNLDLTDAHSYLVKKQSEQAPQHFLDIMRKFRPMFRDKDPRVWLVPTVDRAQYEISFNYSNLSRLNAFGSLMRLLIRGFALDRQRIIDSSGVTIQEMENFYQTVKSLGFDLKLMDPRSQRVGIRSFQEGNMFTFSGNGLQPKEKDHKALLTYTEGVELLAFIWSGGDVRDRIYKNSMKRCEMANAPLDVFGYKKVLRRCFFNHFDLNSFDELSNLPRMKSYMLSLKGAEKTAFWSGLEDIARIQCENPNYVEQAEIATMATILHYIEVLFVVYDRDLSGVLDGYEVMAAFPRFHHFLSDKVVELKKKNYDVKTLKSIFTFLVREGRLPVGASDKWSIWWNQSDFDQNPQQYVFANMDKLKPGDRPETPELALDRSGLLKVLHMLNQTGVKKACPKK